MKTSSFPLGVLVLATLVALAGCASAPAAPGAPAPVAKAKGPKNLALGATVVSNNHILDFTAENAVDGETSTYFEGAANQYPNTLVVDLGKKVNLKELVLKLNPKRLWAPRTQHIEVQSSGDGSSFATLVPAVDYLFDPNDNDNKVTVPVTGTFRYLQLVFTANTEATGGQLAELEVHGQ